MPDNETYIGDGVYVRWDDPATIRLRAPRFQGDHLIWLDAQMLAALQAFASTQPKEPGASLCAVEEADGADPEEK